MRLKHTISILSGLLLVGSLTASANTIVHFQVDMSTTVGFDHTTQTVSVHGDFTGWGAGRVPLTNNPSGSNPYLFSGATNLPMNGTIIQYKFVIDPGTWENIAKGNNRLLLLPAASGTDVVLPVGYFNDTAPGVFNVDVIFQVDMAQQIQLGKFDTNTSTIYPKGTFNGWGTWWGMTNDPSILRTNQNGLVTSNVYVNAYTVTATPGQTMDFKYYIDTGAIYESPTPGTGDPSDNNNRFFTLTDTNLTQTLPLVFFSDAPYAPIATNVVKFQVDLSAQILNGTFDPATGVVEVRGPFNNWGNPGDVCTNDPGAVNTNIYVAYVSIAGGIGSPSEYKFFASGTLMPNGGWEESANRGFSIVSGTAQTLPVVHFSNLDPSGLLSADTLVTFRVNMANAAAYPAGTPFDTTNNTVYFNGNCLSNGWYSTWGSLWPETKLVDDGTAGDAVSGDKVYTLQYLVPKGKTLRVQYKYGIDSLDNEAASGSDHVRYIRSTGTYVMPIDVFGTQSQEPQFGGLTISPPSAGKAMISWLGYPGVYLQSKATLGSGTWTDHLATAGLSSTNFPVGPGAMFFRLIKP